MKHITHSKFLSVAVIALAIVTFGTTAVHADNDKSDKDRKDWQHWDIKDIQGSFGLMKPIVFGKVTAVNGTTLTVVGKQSLSPKSATTTFMVNAASAVVKKNNGTTTLSSVVVGDNVLVQGTVTGTTIVATMIHDDFPLRGDKDKDDKPKPTTTPFVGNGQPVVAGVVSAISSTTITLTNKSNVSYTVNASSARVTEGTKVIALANLAVGDNLIVQGTVNGNAIVAASIIKDKGKDKHGFFGGIGSFFKKLFGF